MAKLLLQDKLQKHGGMVLAWYNIAMFIKMVFPSLSLSLQLLYSSPGNVRFLRIRFHITSSKWNRIASLFSLCCLVVLKVQGKEVL